MGRKQLQAVHLLAMALAVLLVSIPADAAQQYKVVKGDSLWSIAKKFSISIHSIEKSNDLNQKKPLQIGRLLAIPDGPSSNPQGRAVSNSSDSKATAKAETADSKSTAFRSRLVNRALAYRGTRYRRGGTSRGGFDCSGFTRHIFIQDGISLPHSSRAQYSVGQSISRSELRSGDLVFFNCNGRGISHVGIYIGDNKFIHSSNTSRGVTVDSLDSTYYRPRYRGARRVN